MSAVSVKQRGHLRVSTVIPGRRLKTTMARNTPQLKAFAADKTFCVLGFASADAAAVRNEGFKDGSTVDVSELLALFFDLIHSHRMGRRAEVTVTADSDTTNTT